MNQIIKKGLPDRSFAGKVVPREVIAASSEAMRILESAQEEAAQVRAAAQEALWDARAQGYAEGFEKGAAEWAEAVRQARASARGALEAAKPELARMALRVAEKVLRQKLETQPEALSPMIDEALRALAGPLPLRVALRVHPEDAPALEAQRERWLERHPGIVAVQIVADEAFPRGGCRIESDFGTVDATIEAQMKVIEDHLLRGRGEP